MSSDKPGLGDRIGPGAFRDSRFNPYRIGAVAVALAAAIVAATYVGNQSSGGDGTTVAQRSQEPASTPTASAPTSAPASLGEIYKTQVANDYAGVSGQIITYSQALQDWQKGGATDENLGAIFDLGIVNFASTRDALDKRESFEQAPRAIEDFRSSAALFLESARVGKAALSVPKGALRDQLRNQVLRLRALADRTFDQANAELAPFLPSVDPGDGVEFRGATEVPDFVFAGLTPGAPLDTAVRKTADQRQVIEDKPQEDADDWARRVASLTPTAQDLAEAINATSGSQLQALARRFTAASDALYTAPDPRDGHLSNVRVQLGLLVDAESARAAQAASLVSGTTQSQLRTSAQRLALIGDRMWDERLGNRSSGFPQTLLTDS